MPIDLDYQGSDDNALEVLADLASAPVPAPGSTENRIRALADAVSVDISGYSMSDRNLLETLAGLIGAAPSVPEWVFVSNDQVAEAAGLGAGDLFDVAPDGKMVSYTIEGANESSSVAGAMNNVTGLDGPMPLSDTPLVLMENGGVISLGMRVTLPAVTVTNSGTMVDVLRFVFYGGTMMAPAVRANVNVRGDWYNADSAFWNVRAGDSGDGTGFAATAQVIDLLFEFDTDAAEARVYIVGESKTLIHTAPMAGLTAEGEQVLLFLVGLDYPDFIGAYGDPSNAGKPISVEVIDRAADLAALGAAGRDVYGDAIA